MTLKRRSLLAGGIALTGLLVYSAHRGVRIPPLLWEPRAAQFPTDLQGITLGAKGLFRSRTPASDTPVAMSLRAHIPEPALELGSPRHQKLCLSVNNISPQAQLHIDEAVGAEILEEIEGLTRVLKITLAQGSQLKFHWQLPLANGFKFAAIGDTGGQLELQWCTRRAHELGALFLLHLGDFYYTEGDYERAVDTFNHAPLPCYVSLGNHDFHDGGLMYQHFLDDIGPFNSSFTLGGARFINVDTASNILPFGAGPRGQFLRSLADQPAGSSNIAFTHRPLFDPQSESSHDIGSAGERDWLIDALKACRVSTLLSGHIHIHARDTIGGIDNIIVGQGLGHQDLITNRDYSKLALGRVNEHGETVFTFPSLAMPWDWHCHPRSDIVKQSLSEAPHAERIRALAEHCSSTQG